MFWGISPHGRSSFITQECIIRIIMKAKPKDSCKEFFSKTGILTLYSRYIISIIRFAVKHKDLFTLNMEFHNTCHESDLHVAPVSLTKV
jgi:hypothetical protein